MLDFDLETFSSYITLLNDTQSEELKNLCEICQQNPQNFVSLINSWFKTRLESEDKNAKDCRESLNTLSDVDFKLIDGFVSEMRIVDNDFLSHFTQHFNSLKSVVQELETLECSENLKFILKMSIFSTTIEIINKLMFFLICPLLSVDEKN